MDMKNARSIDAILNIFVKEVNIIVEFDGTRCLTKQGHLFLLIMDVIDGVTA